MIDRQQISIKAIISGTIIDLILSGIFGLASGMVFAAIVMPAEASPSQVEDAVWSSSDFFAVSLIGGLLIVVVCGYITARISKKAELLNSTLFGFVGVLLGVVVVLIEERPYPAWFNAMSFLLIVPCAALGGYLSQRVRRVRQERTAA